MEIKRFRGGHGSWEAEVQVDDGGVIITACPMMLWSKGQTVEQAKEKIKEKGWPGPIEIVKRG